MLFKRVFSLLKTNAEKWRANQEHILQEGEQLESICFQTLRLVVRNLFSQTLGVVWAKHLRLRLFKYNTFDFLN